MKKKGLMELASPLINQEIPKDAYDSAGQYIVTAKQKDEMLILAMFNQKNKNKAKIVIWQTKDDYISAELVDGEYKWRTGALTNILNYGWYSYQYGYQNEPYIKSLDDDHETTIKKFTKATDNEKAMQGLTRLQNKILAERLQLKHKKITDPIDREMELVPELPDDWDEWIDSAPLIDSRYLIYKRNKKEINAFCTHCQKDIKLEHAKHDEKGACPLCHTSATYKAQGRAKRLEDYAMFSIMQKVVNHNKEPTILIRHFHATRRFRDYKNPQTNVYEEYRAFYTNDESMDAYHKTAFRQGAVRWHNEYVGLDTCRTILYEKNVKEVIAGTPWQYSAIDIMAQQKKELYLSLFMKNYTKNKKVEYIVKAGLYRLANNNIHRAAEEEQQTQNLKEFLGVGAEMLPQLQRLDVDSKTLRLIQTAYKKGIKLTDDQIQWAERNLRIPSDLIKITDYTTIHKGIKYISKHGKTEEDYIDWLDYLRMSKELGHDMKSTFVLFPYDLKEAHDYVTLQTEYKYNSKHDKAIAGQYPKLVNRYQFSDDKYTIIIPKTAIEIQKEGISLRHCVKTYIDNVAAGKTTILFLRKNQDPEKSFYTIEIRNKKVTQCRGYKNQSMTTKVRKFVETFEKEKLSMNEKKTKKSA